MSKSLYLINPSSDFPTYFSAEVYGGRGFAPAAFVADLAITTLAALAPADFQVTLCDENVSPVDYDSPAAFIGITGKITQYGRMVAIAHEFHQRGKLVVIGGPYASLCPEALRPHCDVLVRGEVEELAGKLFDDLRRGRWQEEYVGGRPELAASPLPRWDLYPNERALVGNVQTSRGCPFECEFCDVIQYLGRKQRHKSPGQVLAELDELYRRRYRSVFLSDDNFTVYRGRAKELLAALRDWNMRREDGRVEFFTQVSIDAAKDPELLRLCAAAGLTRIFIGIETPNVESLRETKKRQNVGVDLTAQVERFVEHGISVSGGMIVGFDADGPDIFERQYQFAMGMPIPVFSVGALVAPDATPLRARLEKAGRLVSDGSEVAALPWNTNIVPKQMSREELIAGIRWLCNRLYDPSAFADRMVRFIEKLGERGDPRASEPMTARNHLRAIDQDSLELVGRLPQRGPKEARMWSRIQASLARKPAATDLVLPLLVQYQQIRYMYERGGFWDTEPARTPATPRAVASA